jgi:hypothetical protein
MPSVKVLKKICTQSGKKTQAAGMERMIMNVQSLARRIRIQEWAAQITEFKQSGLTVRQWCANMGIDKKTYYYRLKRVREEMLDDIETANMVPLSGTADSAESGTPGCPDSAMSISRRMPPHAGVPVFTALPLPPSRGAIITVRIGGYAIDVHNGADDVTVEQVLRVVARL